MILFMDPLANDDKNENNEIKIDESSIKYFSERNPAQSTME